MSRANDNPREAERLCLLGIDAAEAYGLDCWDVPQIIAAGDDSPEELIEGLILYNQLLIATLMIGRTSSPQEIARAARESATAWRKQKQAGAA